MDNNNMYMWRLGIRHKTEWNRWDWSPTFPTFNDVIKEYGKWLEQHPGRVIKIVKIHIFEAQR